MTKNKKIIILVISITILILAILFGYQIIDRKQIYERDYQNIIRVSVILPHLDDGYWSQIEEGFLAGECDYSSKVDVQIYAPQLNYHAGQMAELIRRQTAAKVDAIAVQGIEDIEYKKALIEAIEQGIQVILVDTDIAQFPEHLYIGTDNYQAGIQMGLELAKITSGNAKVAVISGEENYLNLEERYLGLLEIQKSHPNIQFIRLDYDSYDALTVINKYNLIQKENPEIDTLVCIEGTAGQTFGTVLEEKQKHFKHILTFDHSQYTEVGIRNGVIDGTMVQATYEMGYRAIEEIIRYVERGSYSSKCIYTDLSWWTSDDIEKEASNEF